MEAKNETIKRNLLKFKDIDDCRLSDDVLALLCVNPRNGT